MTSKLCILMASAGRRVELIRCFRFDAAELGASIRVISTDVKPELSAACHASDRAFKVPPAQSSEYAEVMLKICRDEAVDLVVPTIDPELIPLSRLSERLAGQNTRVVLAEPEGLRIAGDKFETNRFLRDIGIPCPRTTLATPDAERLSDPMILKPRYGSASQGVWKLRNFRDLDSCDLRGDHLLQEFVEGTEYTVNMYVASPGRVHCAVPHVRLEVRAGEVSKGLTARHARLDEYAIVIARSLPLLGPSCFQAIDPGDGEPKVIEINARFGGGYPVAHRAGARFPRYIMEQALGREPTTCNGWRSGALMLRYDAAIYVDSQS